MKTAAIRQGLWWAFVIWTCLEFLILPLDLGEAQILRSIDWVPMQKMLTALLNIFDAIWLVLAASFLYFYLFQQEGLKSGRRTAGIILLISFAVEWAGISTGLPFGSYIYTGQLGQRILGVPFCIPLLWLVIVCCARFAVLHFFDHAQRWQIALGTGLLTVATDLSLEWVAWRIRAYKLWYFPAANTPEWPPLQNYLAWFALSSILAWVAFPPARPVGKHWQPVIMLGMINLLFWATILSRR